ncbi:hypothetical protein [Novosphingobium sp.]|uniref:hypothetical protein n=1 Tax=Novosphingobium sp. TaxID=1874826 RepID=UPI003B51C610
MTTDTRPFDTVQDASLFRAAALMQQALGLLDHAGESRAATHLQHALDVLDFRLPVGGLPN